MRDTFKEGVHGELCTWEGMIGLDVYHMLLLFHHLVPLLKQLNVLRVA